MKVIYFLTLFFVGNSYACWLGNGKGLCRSGDERGIREKKYQNNFFVIAE